LDRTYVDKTTGREYKVNTLLFDGSGTVAGVLVSGRSGSSGSCGSGGSGIVMGESYPTAGVRIATF
jgi:hypothetical protein